MFRAPTTTLFALSLLAGLAQADVGATLSVQTDARERGISYSDGKPAAQVGVAWDGDRGWYAGASLTSVRFGPGRRSGWWRVYGGRVFELRPGLDAEAGWVAHHYSSAPHYDYHEAYAGLLGDGWHLRLHLAPNHYGSGQRTLYGEFGLRRPLSASVTAIGHVGVMYSHGESRLQPFSPTASAPASQRPTRIDLRAGLSWQLNESLALQAAWVSVSRGGPAQWFAATGRHTAVLGLSAAF